MKGEAKSIVNSLIIIFLYYFALVGIIRLFWNTTNQYQFEGRVKFLGYLLVILTVLFVFVPYHLFSSGVVDIIYKGLIISHLFILFLGVGKYILDDKILS
ncbi:MAG: hypothetical protein FJY17_03750 [Bacteroidetes bacterium]|nr:hypothetical protein [Bacteroidota bacterium]